MAKILDQCPVCQSRMEITQLSCTSCETVVVGRFEPNRFSKLSPESMTFLETFIRNRGNVKDMERETGISYWTIRRRIDELIAELGLEAKPDSETPATSRREILERLKNGEITAEEAGKLLEKLK
ncbi:MAG: hypothetical protein Fur0022_05410 [Anaerolineales bacterium]